MSSWPTWLSRCTARPTQHSPQAVFATESLTQALRQLELYGRDGLPVISDDRQHLQGWITRQNVLQAVARHIHAAEAGTAQPQTTAEPIFPGPRDDHHAPPTPLVGYQVLEVTIPAASAAAGQALADTAWPPGSVPVSVLNHHTLRDPDPSITLAPGDRVNLLAPASERPEPPRPHGQDDSLPASHPPRYAASRTGADCHSRRAPPPAEPPGYAAGTASTGWQREPPRE
jgi:hypothetical protein